MKETVQVTLGVGGASTPYSTALQQARVGGPNARSIQRQAVSVCPGVLVVYSQVRCLADPAQCRAVLSYDDDDDDDATSGSSGGGAGLAAVAAAEPLAGQSSPYSGRSAGAVAAVSAPSGASGLGEIAGGSSSSSSSAAGVSSANGNGTFVSTRSRRE